MMYERPFFLVCGLFWGERLELYVKTYTFLYILQWASNILYFIITVMDLYEKLSK